MTALDAVRALIPHAEAVVGSHVNQTESRDLGWLAPYAGRPVVAKLETQQVTGSFKVRGAITALSMLASGSAVVAASAGNHGLAVAWAASRLGLPADIVLPQNASPLKRERILRYGAGVIETGSTVEEAMAKARLIARRTGRHYVAPFDDPAIVAGQATAVIELLRESPGLRAVIIPVGGGGLLAGAIAAREYLDADVRLIACEPRNFASMAASIRAGCYVRLGRRPTFADGLATNLEPDSITLQIAGAAPGVSFFAVGEEEIAAACAAIFNRESILAEGAAAAAVATALRPDEAGLPDGATGLILSGGNVHHATFWQMVALPQTDRRLIAVADVMGRSVADEPVRKYQSVASDPGAADPGSADSGPDLDVVEAALPADLLAGVTGYAERTNQMLDDFAKLASEDGLPLSDSMLTLAREVNDLVLGAAPGGGEDLAVAEQRLRVLSQIGVAARLAFDWRSPAYDQSAALGVFDLGCLGSPGVNYARYDQPAVADIELRLADLLRISPDTHALLMTSSGMAAFVLAVETVLAAGPAGPVGTVGPAGPVGTAGAGSAITAPYLYFEAMEVLDYRLAGRLTVADSYDAEAIAEQASARGAGLVFADPLANHPDQRMVDVELLAKLLASDANCPWLITDASMLPAVMARPVTSALPDRAVYYESCSKYLQFGLDIAMAGLTVVPRRLEPLARRMRRNLGLGIDRYGAELFPRYQPAQFERRIAVMESAASTMAERLDRLLPDDLCEVVFPSLASHADHEIASRIGRTGSCVTLRPVIEGLARDQLDPVVDTAVAEARRRGVPLVKGVSFGFSTSRMSAASAMAESAPPFLRIAVGPLDPASASRLADVVRYAVMQTSAVWQARS